MTNQVSGSGKLSPGLSPLSQAQHCLQTMGGSVGVTELGTLCPRVLLWGGPRPAPPFSGTSGWATPQFLSWKLAG